MYLSKSEAKLTGDAREDLIEDKGEDFEAIAAEMEEQDRAAYQKHTRRNEEPCPESRAANSAYVRSRAGGKERQRPDCGTYPGYQGHVKRGEPIDDRCAEARRDRDRAYYAARKQAA